mmetsp:Transcript_6907/g.28319  ORF Transcript_6907/g.28319 Transcript_6907/m.28319 type:complete len:376 (-) Transcript_6907:670-1797(-)
MIFFRRSLRSVASAASRISALPRRTVTLAPLASRRVTRSRSRSRANDSNAPDPFGKPETPKTARDAFSESALSFSFVFASFASFESPSKTPAPSRRIFSSSFSFASSSFAKSSFKESSQNASSAPGASQGVEGAFCASAKPLNSVSAAATSAKTTRFSARYCRVSCSMRCKISGRCSVSETPPVGGFKRTCMVCGENRCMRDATCASCSSTSNAKFTTCPSQNTKPRSPFSLSAPAAPATSPHPRLSSTSICWPCSARSRPSFRTNDEGLLYPLNAPSMNTCRSADGSSRPSFGRRFVDAVGVRPRRVLGAASRFASSDASDASAASAAASDVSPPSPEVTFGVSSAARSGAPRFSRTNGGNTVGADDVAMPASH